jgi:hypothetical protein
MGLDGVLILTVFGVTVLAGLLMWLRYWPLALRIADQSDRRPMSGSSDELFLAKVGELVTELMLARDGWKPLSSDSPNAGRRDTIFVRNRLGRHQYEIKFVETLCRRDGSSNHMVHPLDRRTVAQRAAALLAESAPELDTEFAKAIARAIKWGSARVEKTLYLHTLSQGTTHIYKVAQDGRPMRNIAVVATAAHKAMSQAIARNLSKPDVTEPNRVNGAVATHAKATHLDAA